MELGQLTMTLLAEFDSESSAVARESIVAFPPRRRVIGERADETLACSDLHTHRTAPHRTAITILVTTIDGTKLQKLPSSTNKASKTSILSSVPPNLIRENLYSGPNGPNHPLFCPRFRSPSQPQQQ
eukprot:1061565-Rhodomonas_salina.5